MALLMRPVGMGRVSGLGDAATAGQAKPAAMWSADRRLPPLLAARDVCAGEAILLRLWALLAVRSCAAAAAVGERACLVGNLPPDCGLLLELISSGMSSSAEPLQQLSSAHFTSSRPSSWGMAWGFI